MEASGYILPEQAKAINRDALTAFIKSKLFSEIKAADTVLREYDFFTQINAGEIDITLPETLKNEKILVQGIADCILIKDNKVTVIDYKTDQTKNKSQLIEAYKGQLSLYKRALSARLEMPVEKSLIYSFALGEAIEITDI